MQLQQNPVAEFPSSVCKPLSTFDLAPITNRKAVKTIFKQRFTNLPR
jgi:hypothetical protein